VDEGLQVGAKSNHSNASKEYQAKDWFGDGRQECVVLGS